VPITKDKRFPQGKIYPKAPWGKNIRPWKDSKGEYKRYPRE